MSEWLKNLNPEQQAAVLHNHGPLLILAGAGSGKTTVLVSRTGRLIDEKHAPPERICVLTFTNKAATELKHRVAQKLGERAQNVWAGTFHGFGLRFLKEHYQQADLPRRFGVIDGNDAQAIVKDLMRAHKHYEKDGFKIDKVLNMIGEIRARSKALQLDTSPEAEMAEMLAPKYMQRLRQLGVVDFEELLLRPLRLLKEDSRLRMKMQGRYDFVMVDEFQDTNATQMLFIDEMTAGHRNIAVVGDDDQSIYGWRGAEIQNILGFPKRYKTCEVIRLERNYRSTPKILDMANAIISTNKARHTKVLKPAAAAGGELPELFTYENEDAEMEQVVQELSLFRKKGYAWKDMAVLYRSNSQGGLMEGGLRRAQIPYKVSGGTALFDRKEAKDVLAFIRCALWPTEVAYRRIINLPARGIGDKTLEAIEGMQTNGDFPLKAKLWAKSHPSEKPAAAIGELQAFLERLKTKLVSSTQDAEQVLLDEMRQLGYRKLIEETYREKQSVENRWMCVSIVGRIISGMFERHGRSLDTLELFVDSMELRDPVDAEAPKDEVQMMTLHACKGLEFPLVFLLGLEEDLLPHAKLGQNVDEERRLFYVGVTRAQKHLILTRCRQRKRYGQLKPVAPSRFLMELNPSLYIQHTGGRPMKADERKTMVSDLLKQLEKKIADRDVSV